MKVRFIAEIVEDNGNIVKTPVTVETDVPDISEFTDPTEFYTVFDRFERTGHRSKKSIGSRNRKGLSG